MKTRNEEGKGPTTNKGGSLREDMYDAFATYCVAYCKAFKQQTGVELYALGLAKRTRVCGALQLLRVHACANERSPAARRQKVQSRRH
jgi:hypothetical protein